MNYVEVGTIILVIFSVLLGISLYVYHKKGGSISAACSWVFGICVVSSLIAVSVYAGCTYYDALSLPYDYQAACDTVNETTQLLMRYDHIQNGSFNSVGYGLESQELKIALKDAIQTKNSLHAEILRWVHDPMACYKDVLINRLPENFS